MGGDEQKWDDLIHGPQGWDYQIVRRRPSQNNINNYYLMFIHNINRDGNIPNPVGGQPNYIFNDYNWINNLDNDKIHIPSPYGVNGLVNMVNGTGFLNSNRTNFANPNNTIKTEPGN